jgi:predicted nucleic-acid-binding protein
MRAVDTNVLVRLLVADDPAQASKAEAFLATGAGVWISIVILVETVWVLTAVYGWQKPQLLAMLDTATTSKDFSFQAADAVSAALSSYRSGKADFADCLAVELARAEGHLPFATFDKATGALPGAQILR